MSKLLLIFLNLISYVIYSTGAADEEKFYEFHFEKVESFNGTNEYYKYDYNVLKQDGSSTIFNVDANLELMQDLDDNWNSDIALYRKNDAGEFEIFFQLPKMGICQFMKTVYRKYFYEKISKHSNLPHYDVCPVPKEKYTIKGYPLDAHMFRRIISPGEYRLNAFLIQNKIAVSGLLIYGSVLEK